jgi:glutamate formiminotransferase/glutamate formiminotransferase/formiminotetrahydrofolate cyclodeaminase
MPHMPPTIACIPNFSEGRNPAVIEALTAAVTSVPRVWLLHHTMDADHHRAVLTFAGLPDAVGEAAFRAIAVATELIDLRRHAGAHPRIGSTDVVPFVPVQDAGMEECVRVARSLGQKVGTELGIPVFLYEEAATQPKRAHLEHIRRGGLPGLAARMASDAAWAPDFGPARLHERAGAVVIGARHPLIAFNVNFSSTDLQAAQAVAKAVRHSNGGLPCLKAIGVALPSRGMVQVAMNLTDYRSTSIYAAFEAVKNEAAKRGLTVAGSELIGLIPQAALDQTAQAAVRLEGFASTQVLEFKLRAAMSEEPISDRPIAEFLEAVADARPTPAGGSVAALVGALAASLGALGARVSGQEETRQRLLRSCRQLHALVQADTEAYGTLARSRTCPDRPFEPSAESALAWQRATVIPLEMAELACQVGRTIRSCLETARSTVHPDLTVGVIMAIAAAEAGLHLARANVRTAQGHRLGETLLPRILKVAECLEELKALCYTPPPDQRHPGRGQA